MIKGFYYKQLGGITMYSHNTKLKTRIAILLGLILRNSSDKHLSGLIVDRFLWAATEDNDQNKRVKYLGQPYWSKQAIKKYQEQNQGKKSKCFSGLRHEHIFPRNMIKTKIFQLEHPTPEKLFSILDKYCHAVIITTDEDQLLNAASLNKKMPESFEVDGLIESRYKQVGIEIVSVIDCDLKTKKI
jgi:hypothetical protein